jgi:spore coat protein A
MKEFKQKLHRDLPPTTVWGYEGMYPGPTIVVNRNEKVKVKWENHLPVSQHLLPVDTSIHGAGPDTPRVRTVVHLHGANVSSDSDGYPEAWFTNNYKIVSPKFKRKVYEYPNRQRATTLWYHDHAIGTTRLNVYAGLAGFYIIHDKEELSLNLPKFKYDIPLIIQDKTFLSDGSLSYPTQPNNPSPELPNPSIVPAFFGDTILVNGKVWPYLEVEPRKYRFRLLNGSNDRFYNMRLETEDDAPAPKWYQIGTDGGLLERPVQLNQLIMAPAERAEIIIDFSEYEGGNILLTNSQTPVDVNTTGQIMQFKVTLPLTKPDTSTVPSFLSPIYPMYERDVDKTREMFIRVLPDRFGRPHFLLNGVMWDDPITEKPLLGSIEIWNIINSGLGIHPIHVHLVQFQILNRQPFDVAVYNSTNELVFTGPPVPPDPNENGWKDTVRANPGFVTRIIMKFADYPGLYVWHCHILEHEDYDMMRPIKVRKRKWNKGKKKKGYKIVKKAVMKK